MTAAVLRTVWISPQQAGASLNAVVVPWCRSMMSAGHRLSVEIRPEEDARSIRQNSFYWGFVLKQISQQARINGIGANIDGWHYFLKKNVLGYRITKTKIPGSNRPVVRRELKSTRGLSVKAMAKYLEEVMAIAATDYGVDFDGKRWEDWNENN